MRWNFATNGEITSGANFAGDKVSSAPRRFDPLLPEQDPGKLLWKLKTKGPVNGSPPWPVISPSWLGATAICTSIDSRTVRAWPRSICSRPAGGHRGRPRRQALCRHHEQRLPGRRLAKKASLWTYTPSEASRSTPPPPSPTSSSSSAAGIASSMPSTGPRATWFWTSPPRGKSIVRRWSLGSAFYVGCLTAICTSLTLPRGVGWRSLTLGRSILASPAVSNGCLVIGTTDGHLYCLGKLR